MEKDLGIEIIKHLIEEVPDGAQIRINDFLEIEVNKQNRKSEMKYLLAGSLIQEMIDEGYLKENKPELKRLYNYGRPSQCHMGEIGNNNVTVGVTWKGRTFYYDRVKKGVLDRQEKIGLYIVIGVSVISMVISGIQLRHTIRQDKRNQSQTTEEISKTNQPSIEENNPRKTLHHHTRNSSSQSTATETLRAKEIDTALLQMK